jgi:hypothetical protein
VHRHPIYIYIYIRYICIYIYAEWSKSLCAPAFCIVIIRCRETFWSPCIYIYTGCVYIYIIYGIYTRCLCTCFLYCNRQVHRDFWSPCIYICIYQKLLQDTKSKPTTLHTNRPSKYGLFYKRLVTVYRIPSETTVSVYLDLTTACKGLQQFLNPLFAWNILPLYYF